MSNLPIQVIGWDGQPRDLAYLRVRYGDFTVTNTGPTEGAAAFWVSKFRERADGPIVLNRKGEPEATASLVVSVKDEAGHALAGIRVAFYWPDAPPVPEAGGLGRCVDGVTNAEGVVGFGMGPGAFYWPSQGETGPHAVWIYGAGVRGELVQGLGMIALSNHYHFDVEYRLVSNPEPPPPPPPVDLAAIRDKAIRVRRLANQILDLLPDDAG